VTSPQPSGPALFLLGGIALNGVPSAIANQLLAQSKAVALLAYLALSPPGRYQRRDRIVGLLWPELDQVHARAALRKAVFAVRSALGAEAIASRGDEELALAPGALWCDALELNACADDGRLARAIELYRGELMPGFHLPECGDFDLWLEDQRAGARERAAAAAWALARLREGEDKFTEAGSLARRAVRFSWNDERVLRRALTMLDRLGDRAGALGVYEEFARRLRSELEAEPSAETAALVATMRSHKQ
jgi:DNA-binding SARP family transcriptional activator